MSQFVRKHSWFRVLKPWNILGALSGYGSCECGENFWLWSGRGYMTSSHGGHITCKTCSKVFEKEIDDNDHRMMITPPSLRFGRIGYQICQIENCAICREDDNKYWNKGWLYKEEYLRGIKGYEY